MLTPSRRVAHAKQRRLSYLISVACDKQGIALMRCRGSWPRALHSLVGYALRAGFGAMILHGFDSQAALWARMAF
jgi:hypothetical protein